MSRVGILGAGGMAREAARYLFDPVSFYAVNKDFLDRSNPLCIDVEEPTEEQRIAKVVAAIGAPAIRKAMVDAWPGSNYINVIAASADVYSESLGVGIIIGPKSVITTDTEIGDHVIINVGATVSHDCKLGDYATISPGVHIAGGVRLGDGVFVGIGATVSNDVRIADGVVIGAGATVVTDVSIENSIIVGNPAKTLRVQEGWLRRV